MSKDKIIYQASSIILDNNKITCNKYKSNCDKLYQIGSCSKFITSILVGKLYELGKLDYDDDINNYLKKWKCKINGITLRHLLSHTSGISDENNDEYSYLEKTNKNIKHELVNITENRKVNFLYSSVGYRIIQRVIENITKKKLRKLLDKYIFEPLAMKNSTGKLILHNNKNKYGYNLANTDENYKIFPDTGSAGIWMSCNDLLKVITDFINGYNNDSSKILKQTTIKIMTKGECSLKPEKKYPISGLGIFIYEIDEKKTFGHLGINPGYVTKFHFIPTIHYVKIYMIEHNQHYEGKSVINEAKYKMKLQN